MASLRRPPKTKALIGTPSGFSHSGSSDGHWLIGAVNRAFGCAAFRPDSGVHGRPCQSISSGGGVSVMPSHQTSPSGVSATFVKIEFAAQDAMAFGFEAYEVPGATPKKPYSGLIAYRRPSLPSLIQAMSSPTVVTFQSLISSGGISMAKFVLPHA